MGRLIDLQTAKDFVGVTSTSNDTLIGFLLDTLTEAIGTYIGVSGFDYATIKDVFYPTAGELRSLFKLSRIPVDITQPFTVEIVNFDETTKTTVDANYYYIIADRGSLFFKKPEYILTANMIEVSYTAGYQTDANNVYIGIPDGLKLACLMWFSTLWNTREMRGIERVDNNLRQSLRMAVQEIPPDVKEVLQQYQRVSF